jgi:beta-N-acetylhexosaminidase
MTASAAIYGCAGPTLSEAERRFFRRVDPFGFILFLRNVETPEQVARLTAELRETVGRADAPVLIDQEGGRVARLKPPHWRAAPPAARFGQLASHDREGAAEAVRLNARLLALELRAVGVDVDCAPVLDLRLPGAHDVIGDRAFGADPEIVAYLGRAMMDGFLEASVIPVAKHIPGHGRATVDSHHALPRVTTARAELEETDFRPFRLCADAPWAMTAHVVYSAIDDERPATTSPILIRDVIRGQIGFSGLLLSDDLSMQALSGTLGQRAQDALAAGCDIALHCNGKLDEMEAVAGAVGPLSLEAAARIAAGRARLGGPAEAGEMAALNSRLKRLLAV